MLSLLPLLLSAPSFDWPQFLGPARNGVVAESEWSAVGASEPLWAKNVGVGYSCPSIVGERLVTMGFDGEAEVDRVLCLEAATGAELWRHEYPATDAPRFHGGGTLTTPAIVDGIVYTSNRHGRVFALDLETGAVRWERDLKGELELESVFHGYCASPVVLADRILLAYGGTALAISRDGGELLWRTEDYGDGAYTNATVFEREGRTLMAVMLAQELLVLDAADGAIVHQLAWPLAGNAVHCAQPLVIDDRMLISTAYNKGAAMLRMGTEIEPEVLWSSRRLRNKVTGLYLHDGHVYGFDESMLKCVDLDGNELWRVRGLGMGALSIVGGRLLVLSSRGELVVAEAAPEEFRELSRKKVLDGGSYWTQPVLVDGRIFVRNSLGDMACLDHRGEAGIVAEAAPQAGPAPSASELFEAHAVSVGAEELRALEAVRLDGAWEILGRGMSSTPGNWSFVAPNRWQIGLPGDDFDITFDGELVWERYRQRVTLGQESEQSEAPIGFVLADLFAPVPGDGARVAARPEPFGDTRCWRVDSTVPVEDGEPRAVQHFFAVDDGRLVGRSGDGLSTTIFQGRTPVGSAVFPATIVIYREGSGQEETFTITGGEVFEPEASMFERPEGLARLLRTDEERARDTERLRAEFADRLGLYEFVEGPGPDDDLTLVVDDGDLYLGAGSDRSVFLPHPEREGVFVLPAWGPVTFEFVRDDEGVVTGGRMTFGEDQVNYSKRSLK